MRFLYVKARLARIFWSCEWSFSNECRNCSSFASWWVCLTWGGKCTSSWKWNWLNHIRLCSSTRSSFKRWILCSATRCFQKQNGQASFTQPTGQQYQEHCQQQPNQNQFANQAQSFAQQGYPYQQPNGGQPNQFVGQPQSSGPQGFNHQAYQNNPQGQFNAQNFQQGPQAYYSQQQPAQPSEFSKTMKGFWAWLISAWKSPTSEVESSTLNGYLSLGLTVFLQLLWWIIIFIILFLRWVLAFTVVRLLILDFS